MNKIGKTVVAARDHFKISPEKPENIIVVHDDVSQEVGKYQIYQGPTALQYNGIAGVSSRLHSDKYIRISVGIGPSNNLYTKDEIKQFVMGDFDYMDMAVLKDQVFP